MLQEALNQEAALLSGMISMETGCIRDVAKELRTIPWFGAGRDQAR
jgi:hypothetical protein